MKQKQKDSKNAGYLPLKTNDIIYSYKYKKANKPISIYIKLFIMKSANDLRRVDK